MGPNKRSCASLAKVVPVLSITSFKSVSNEDMGCRFGLGFGDRGLAMGFNRFSIGLMGSRFGIGFNWI